MAKVKSGDEGKVGATHWDLSSQHYEVRNSLTMVLISWPGHQGHSRLELFLGTLNLGNHPAFLSQFQPFPALKRIILELYAKQISAGGIWVWPYPPTLLLSGLYKNIFNWLCWVDIGQFFHFWNTVKSGKDTSIGRAEKNGYLEWYWIKEDATHCSWVFTLLRFESLAGSYRESSSYWARKKCSIMMPNFQRTRRRAVQSMSLFTKPHKLKDAITGRMCIILAY